MTITAIKLVSIFMQILLAAVDKWGMPKAQPSKYQEPVVFLSVALSITATQLDVPFYQYLRAANIWIVLGVILAFAVAPPIVGKWEAKKHGDPEIYEASRFKDHLVNNLAGGAVAAAFIFVARWTTDFDTYTQAFKNEAAFNIVLPLTVVTIFAFVRWQQDKECPNLDRWIDEKNPQWEADIKGYSLRYYNQMLNVAFLIIITFVGASTILYMFAFTLDKARNHDPLQLSWPLAIAMVGILAFLLYFCGRPSMKVHEAVYLNFLTGAPAALMVIVVWIALLQESTVRNYFALAIIVLGYASYSLLVILGNRENTPGNKAPLHYFSSMAFAVALTLLAGALYIS